MKRFQLFEVIRYENYGGLDDIKFEFSNLKDLDREFIGVDFSCTDCIQVLDLKKRKFEYFYDNVGASYKEQIVEYIREVL